VNHDANWEPGTYLPKITHAESTATPNMVASTVFPFLILNIHKPIMMAIGIVVAIVNVPHELSDKELITTKPNPAKAITIIINTAILVVMPLIFSDLCFRNFDNRFTVMVDGSNQNNKIMCGSCHYGTDKHAYEPGKISELGSKYRANQGTCACYCREMMTEQNPFAHGIKILSIV
jgi:hypothetical protein